MQNMAHEKQPDAIVQVYETGAIWSTRTPAFLPIELEDSNQTGGE
jgi:hypothetical protein